jgi:uncharacterized protein (DUF983 family)
MELWKHYMSINTKESGKTVLLRGLKKRCPHCGQGKVLRGYLTQRAACLQCGEDLSTIRADDGPPWLTILLVGHIMAPFVHYFITHDTFPQHLELPIMMVVAVLGALWILPHAKGLFIALIWLTRQKRAD